MKTAKNSFTWKRGLCAALSLPMLLLAACGAKTDAGANGTANTTTPMTIEMSSTTTAHEELQLTEAPAPETTEQLATELLETTTVETEPAETPEPTEFVPDQSWPTGSCGADLTWYFDAQAGQLTIVGSGTMEDYERDRSIDYGVSTPWCDYQEKIKTVNLPEGMTSIGDLAFYHCMALTSVTIPESVTHIGDGAFSGCKALRDVTISSGATEVSWGSVFQSCIHLESIDISADNAAYCNIDGVVFNQEQTELLYYPMAKTTRVYTIPDGVTELREGAFADAMNLSEVRIADSVTKIGDEAFSGCSALRKVTIGSGVTSIGEDAFLACALQEVTIPENVEEIGAHAFGYELYGDYTANRSFVIHGSDGSAAQTYAEENNFKFRNK